MREILFRGKRIDNGEWVYGDLVHIGNKSYISYYYESALSTFINETIEYDGISIVGVAPLIEVDSTTVGQYTGLTDKNDKKIFEGDIVKIKSVLVDFERVTAVMYGSGLFGVKHEDHSNHSIIPLRAWYDSQIEVISNIYDSPELLEDKQ